MRRVADPRLIYCLLLGSGLLLAVAAVPGLRHRHFGDAGHDHSQGQSISHAHGRDGWHVHFSLFGIEVTVWEPAWVDEETDLTENMQPATGSPETDAGIEQGSAPALLAFAPVTAGWNSLFWIEPAPVPQRLTLAEPPHSLLDVASACHRAGLDSDPPPVPPPEIV